jgi:hypothetical protein
MSQAIDWQTWTATVLVIAALAHLAWRLVPRRLRARWLGRSVGESSACGACAACGPRDASCSSAASVIVVRADAMSGRRASPSTRSHPRA